MSERFFTFSFDGRRVALVCDGEAPTMEELRQVAEHACAFAVDRHDIPLAASCVTMPAVFLERVLGDARRAQGAHQEVLERCTALKLENQELRRAARHDAVEVEELRRRARVADDHARVARQVRATCDICAASTFDLHVPPAVLVTGAEGVFFLCADHAPDASVKGRRVDLREPHDDSQAAGPERDMKF